ncbi:hypothetical protein T4D_1505 [Trichinella pseudospiralis]|uniref:Uncharacterized protein n=1 Tax=Trichinella pseudospiralis TaxID=6337 RepID=A0A0V1C3F6_TRIPS|nr:hypothetical protein T4D_1505 [Trichinella pseudospiralis]
MDERKSAYIWESAYKWTLAAYIEDILCHLKVL